MAGWFEVKYALFQQLGNGSGREKKKPPDGGLHFLYAIKGISVPLCF